MLNKNRLMQYIAEQYGADAEFPWIGYPNYAVYRHRHNRKWFALIMEIPKSKLGLAGGELITVLNVKCDPILIGSLRNEKGVFPAYHMDKANWITIALDITSEDQIKWLLEQSYQLTESKKQERR